MGCMCFRIGFTRLDDCDRRRVTAAYDFSTRGAGYSIGPPASFQRLLRLLGLLAPAAEGGAIPEEWHSVFAQVRKEGGHK